MIFMDSFHTVVNTLAIIKLFGYKTNTLFTNQFSFMRTCKSIAVC